MIVSIIGAGIGGLSLGIALKQQGIGVKIYEAASEFKQVGAGIILGCNAMQVYRKLGIMETLMEKGNPIHRLSITNHELNTLSSISLDYFVKKYQVGNYAIHRADLHQVLLSQYEDGEVVLNKKLTKLDVAKNQMQFEDGEKLSYQVLIGADGIHSRVRKEIIVKEYKIRSAGQMCWRGVVDYRLPSEYQNEFREAWGRSSRVGLGQINEKQVYWFALITSTDSAASFEGKNWRSHFDGYDPLVKELLAKTPDSSVHTAGITDLQPLEHWYSKNVCLIGDAAHAMTPNMGQGAGQSIEDALALARYITNHKKQIEKGFQEFQQYRIKKVKQIVNNSWRIGKLAHVNSSPMITLRNTMMKLTPASASRKAMAKTFEI